MSIALDRLVAEKVMGWTLADRWACGWGKGPSVYITNLEKSPTWQDFTPSTDIAAAWEVVEHLRKQKHEDGGRKYLVSMIDHTDSVEIVVEDFREGDSWLAVNESAPMAICLAALRAMNVPEATIQEACK